MTVMTLTGDASMPTPEDFNSEKLPHLLARNLGGLRSSDDCADRPVHRGGQSFQLRDRFIDSR
jgi:hypothetical protein